MLLGITEHTKGIAGTCEDIYFVNLKVVPRQMFGIELMLGAEINILDYKGTLSLGKQYMKHLDLRIAGIHKMCYKPGTPRQNTDAVLGAIANPEVDIISHPDDGTCPSYQSSRRWWSPRGASRSWCRYLTLRGCRHR